jgi:enoyl-[acyl-carrier protein] reductase/trans-2-enoyl-CoA reductase (NAD+)
MGGEDWQMWIDALDAAGVLADGAKTTAYTYIGEKLTWDIYRHRHHRRRQERPGQARG